MLSARYGMWVLIFRFFFPFIPKIMVQAEQLSFSRSSDITYVIWFCNLDIIDIFPRFDRYLITNIQGSLDFASFGIILSKLLSSWIEKSSDTGLVLGARVAFQIQRANFLFSSNVESRKK